ncbi:hypothetical protein [Burkholderia cepacia]|nr:hypothetical protein [Burkholderia cepacia]
MVTKGSHVILEMAESLFRQLGEEASWETFMEFIDRDGEEIIGVVILL